MRWQLSRRYTSEINALIGPDKDIPAPDVNTGEQVMAWMMDTYSMNLGRTVTGVVTGKPVSLGGSLGRKRATGRGVFIVAREAARRIGLELAGARIAIQGCGNVGAAAAELFAANGALVVALQDTGGAIYDPRGLNIAGVLHAKRETGSVAHYGGAERTDAERFWSEAEINQRLEQTLIESFGAIWDVARQKRVALRTAAFIVACRRVLEARATRGLYP